jgi:hypothetical protein
MKVQRDKLQQYQKRIKVVTDRETEVARECLRQGHKDKALLALRRKKYQESLLTKTDQQLAQLQALTSDVEFALVQKDVVFGLQQGTAVLKEIHKEMGGLERVELILSESDEARAYQEVSMGGRDDFENVRLIMVSRKSTSCLVGKCLMQTRTKWKTSLRLWNRKRTLCLLCLMHLQRSRSLCPVFQQTILSEQEKFRSKGHSSGVQKKPWQHEHWTFAVLTGHGVLLAVLIHNTQTFEQILLTTLTALQAIGFSKYERVPNPKDTYNVKASVQYKYQYAASIMVSLALMPSRNISTTKIGD